MKVRVAVAIVGGLVLGGAIIAYFIATDTKPPLPAPSSGIEDTRKIEAASAWAREEHHTVVDLLAASLTRHLSPDQLERIHDELYWSALSIQPDGRVLLKAITYVDGAFASIALYFTVVDGEVTLWEAGESVVNVGPTPGPRHPFETALTGEFVNDHRDEIIDILAATLEGHTDPDMLEERIHDRITWIGHGEMSDGRVKLDVMAIVGGVGASVTIYLTLGKDSVTSWEVEEARLIDNDRKEKP